MGWWGSAPVLAVMAGMNLFFLFFFVVQESFGGDLRDIDPHDGSAS